MINAAGSRNTHLDLQYHLQAASRAFHANKWILCDKGVSVLHRLRYFEKVISCYLPNCLLWCITPCDSQKWSAKLDVEYRRLMRMVVCPLQTLIGHHPGTRFYTGGTTKYRCCRTTLDWNLGLSHAVRQYGSSLLMLQPCPRNVGLAGFLNGTSGDHGNEEDLLTLGRQRCKGKGVAIGLWRLLRIIIGCGRYGVLCFSHCALVDRVKSCISCACALTGLPSGRQALTLTLKGGFTCSAHWKWRFICDANHWWHCFSVAGAVFGEVGGWLFVAGAAHRDILADSRSTTCYILQYKIVSKIGPGKSRSGGCEMTISCSDHGRIILESS